jgi:hypothetical protein
MNEKRICLTILQPNWPAIFSRYESCVMLNAMSSQALPLVLLNQDGSVLCVDPVVSQLSALKTSAAQVDTTKWVPRSKDEFIAFVSSLDATLDEVHAGEWDHAKAGLKELSRSYAVDLERWKNKAEREKYETTLKAEALKPLLLQEARKQKRQHYGANKVFESCAYFLNGYKPKDDELSLSTSEQRLIEETRAKLIALRVFRPFSYRSFSRWFISGEAEGLVKLARKTDVEIDLIISNDAMLIADWTKGSAT